jgi:hypothetical protein
MSATNTSEHTGATLRLAAWVSDLSLTDVPVGLLERAKYLILDGIACGLVGAHLPWSERAAKAVFGLEPQGDAAVIGWDRNIGAQSAALLNSSFIQGFELDVSSQYQLVKTQLTRSSRIGTVMHHYTPTRFFCLQFWLPRKTSSAARSSPSLAPTFCFL